MPLPFLKPRAVAGVIISHRKPDGQKGDERAEGEEDQGILSAAEDLIRAIHSKDAQSVASALRAAFEICDSQPHEEGPHTNDESYDSLNERAAKGNE